MAANRHTCLTKPSRAGRKMMINPPLPPAKAGQALQGGGFVNTLRKNTI